MHPVLTKPIGYVRNTVHGAKEDYWGDVPSTIALNGSTVAADALAGLEEFSHVEIFFYFHEVDESAVVAGSRYPRGNRKWPLTGIFAQRGKDRPNRLGATICQLLSVNRMELTVLGLDAFDGTPILDIKPVFAEFLPAREDIRQPQWSRELMAKYFSK